jgi:hypothetical protein
MSRLRPRLPVFFLISLALVACLWWTQRQSPAPSIAGWEGWNQTLFQSLADGGLRLGRLAHEVPGELWLQPATEGGRLLYRGRLAGAAGWQLQAEVGLEPAERTRVLQLIGLAPATVEQRLPTTLLEQLDQQSIAALTLKPDVPPSAAAVVATLGEPRLQLELASGKAWVYPQRGLTAHLLDGTLVMLQLVPARNFRR